VSGSSIKWSIKKYFEENEERTGEKNSPVSDKEQGAQPSIISDFLSEN
jgi:hypothetical protein